MSASSQHKRLKIGIVSSIPAVPAIEGNSRRILHLSRAVRELGHEVHFVMLPSAALPNPDFDGHSEEFGVGKFTYLSPDTFHNLNYLLKRFMGELKRRLLTLGGSGKKYYYGLDEFFPQGCCRRLGELQRRIGFDAVIVEYVYHSAAFNQFPEKVLKILDAHDNFADRHKPFGYTNYLFSLPVSEQVRGFARADIVIAIQKDEAELFRQQLASAKSEVVLVGHLLDLGRRVSDYSAVGATLIGADNAANVAAANEFIRDVLPLIREALPDFRLMLAGKLCQKVKSAAGVVKLGIVEHVADAFAQAPISINTVLQGTGMNIKLLDAMSSGVVTVASSTGARGLPSDFKSGVIVVADGDYRQMARSVIMLAQDQSLRQAKGMAAYQDAVAWNRLQRASLERLFSRAG